MTTHSLTITGGNAKVPFAAMSGAASGGLAAKWIQCYAPTGNNANTILLGNGEVTASNGFPLIAGAGMFYPPIAEANQFYNLSEQFAYVPTGATLNILYGV